MGRNTEQKQKGRNIIMIKKRCIVIDRQYGSGGREVGKLLAGQLDMPFYDRELLVIAAERYGLNPGVMEALDEKRSGSLLHDIAMFAGNIQNYTRLQEPYERYQAISDTIRHLALDGPCIFIGRCADTVLKDVCKFINVFIYASDMEARIRRAHEIDHVDLNHIDVYIRRRDEQRREYRRHFSGGGWGVMENYDLCLNTSVLGYQKCADMIAGLME